MNHTTLREIAKIGTGLVVADIISTLWFSTAGFLPMTLLGVRWTATMVPEILVFDIALLLFLVHFAWNMKLPIQSPSERTLLLVAGIIFLVMAVGHLSQLALNVHLWLGDFQIPAWISWLGILITAYLAYACFHFARHMGRR
ncbi:MAG: hypothetical protein Q7R54_02295 [bacterium]|nr:hypothetical protein [bacterium]